MKKIKYVDDLLGCFVSKKENKKPKRQVNQVFHVVFSDFISWTTI